MISYLRKLKVSGLVMIYLDRIDWVGKESNYTNNLSLRITCIRHFQMMSIQVKAFPVFNKFSCTSVSSVNQYKNGLQQYLKKAFVELMIGTSKDIMCLDANTRQNELSYLTIQQNLCN